ncbi:MAG TPA: cupredoxin family copper-binding protein [Chloroflexota bacterium]|nr:cupredoxin family copper-binding protein [Chloroflexota bacterium]
MKGRKTASLAAAALLAGTAAVVAISPHRVAQAQTATVTIRNFAFAPATLTIAAGTTVTWMNADSVAHTSTSDPGDAMSWDSGSISPGSSFSLTFTQAGTFTYHCSIHPFMKGTIIVAAGVTSTATATSSVVATATATSGGVTATATTVPLSAVPGPGGMGMGPASLASQPTWQGYYDGHKDTYLSTDVSSAAMAAEMHIRYAPGLRNAAAASVDPMYLVPGRAATNQLAVFGSQPGESDYSPLWREITVTWKSGVKPVLLTSDNQIFALQHKGRLTLRRTQVILNCPIIRYKKG